ncbi:MAG: hypothetical protein ACJ73D_01000 [Pyrinomonadaceae bacterium]
MRIQEMRSGRAYLAKRVSAQQRIPYGSRALEERELDRKEEEQRIYTPHSELEKSQWSLVSFGGVEAGGLTYQQATRLMEALSESGIKGLCIITDVAALKID